MAYSTHKVLAIDQTINVPRFNGVGKHIGDCIFGVGSSGTDTTVLYLDTGTLKSYAFEAFVDGYHVAMAASSDVGSPTADGTHYVHLAYNETEDDGGSGDDYRASGSVGSVAFAFVISSSDSTPVSGYDGSLVIGSGSYDYTTDDEWDSITDTALPVPFYQKISAPNIDMMKFFAASATSLNRSINNGAETAIRANNFRIPITADYGIAIVTLGFENGVGDT